MLNITTGYKNSMSDPSKYISPYSRLGKFLESKKIAQSMTDEEKDKCFDANIATLRSAGFTVAVLPDLIGKSRGWCANTPLEPNMHKCISESIWPRDKRVVLWRISKEIVCYGHPINDKFIASGKLESDHIYCSNWAERVLE